MIALTSSLILGHSGVELQDGETDRNSDLDKGISFLGLLCKFEL
jgi:hypothetical protein